ncbi:MAG: M15 family metallopeptidase [Candidatus Thorarchaeota archaeon]|jgi:peptidoglycan L-alanyl-D-glutamate endopeptidase CwlK
MPSFGKTSRERLSTVHPDLQRLFNEVIKHMDCKIIEGKRSLERQRELFESDPPRTHTMASKHLSGDAVDVAPWPIDWGDKERQYIFASLVLDTAMRMGIRIRWGGWFRAKGNKIFYDSPHFELLLDWES